MGGLALQEEGVQKASSRYEILGKNY